MVIAPVGDCRKCRRDEIKIERPPTPGGFSFALLPLVDGLIFAPSESHKNDHTKPLFFRPFHYTTHQTNTTQRATESDRTNHQSTTAGAEARTAAPTERQKKDRHRLRRERSKFRFRPSKFYLSKFQNLRSKFSWSNSRLRHFRDSVLQAQRSTFAHQEDCSE